MKKIIPIILVLVTLAFGQFRKVATTGYAFLEIPVSARFAAMGGITTALSDAEADALFSNPGQLGFAENTHGLHLSYAGYLAETRHQAIGYFFRHPAWGTFGVSINYLDMGTMTETVNADPNNPGGKYLVLGNFNAGALAAGLTYSRRLTDLFAFGLHVKFVEEKIAQYRSNNFVFDLGMMYHTGFHSLRIGGYIQNFGVDSEYFDDNFKMPMIFRLGAAAEIFGAIGQRHRLTLATEALHPSNYSERLHVGLEYCFIRKVFLRGGYKFNYDLGGFSAGAGIRWPSSRFNLQLDGAYSDFAELGSVLRFGLNVRY